MSKQRGSTLVGVFIIVLWVAALVGWVLNLIEIIKIVNEPIAGMFVLRCIGIFVAPLGAVLGYV